MTSFRRALASRDFNSVKSATLRQRSSNANSPTVAVVGNFETLAPTCVINSDHAPSRRKLALVSTSTATSSSSFACSGSEVAVRQSGLANANASSNNTAPRRRRSNQCSTRLREVTRGGDGDKNISVENSRRPRGVRRHK